MEGGLGRSLSPIFQVCACTQYEDYATLCEKNNVDLPDWTKDITFCPMNCPDGMVYMPNGPSPHPTCESDEKSEIVVRGCFCPDIENMRLHKGKCVHKDTCKDISECLFEGKVFKIDEEIDKESTCETCTCTKGGDWNCLPKTCPALNCEFISI